ncbi:MFS transporter [Paenibacillus sp. SYP-B3998]|uniref:MFS transporter n=1 Tax=Paenibacillus sp. SYP-B3998 TaxID=2678564 RepID=A0A6G3ZU45_9BACL|nr:MFS transporter [Paenibacillus sp. SYP-B3998]NEW04937.1 MFS transporter [Paenibacillus sp. SYP-B3998]
MLNNRYVRTVIFSHVLLQLGIWVRNLAILLYVTDLNNNDPHYVSLISVAEFAPIFIFAIIGGTFADRWQPKRTMVGCDLLSAFSVIIVIVALMYGSWYSLLVGTFFSAMLSQFSQPSAMKLFKQHVPAEQLQGVMAMFQSLMAVFMVIGPLVGTFIYQHYGIVISLILTGIMFLGSALVLLLLPNALKPSSELHAELKADFKKELVDGLKYVWANRSLRVLSATFAVTGLGAGFVQPLTLFIVIENLGKDKSFLQWLLMANGASMLLGGLVTMVLAKKVKPQTLLAMGLLVSTCCTIGVGWSSNITLTLIFQVVNGFFYPCIHIGIQTLVMRNTESAFVGRVGGVITPIFMGMMVIGMSLAGYLKDTFSLITVFAASGGLFLIGILFLSPLLQKNSTAERRSNSFSK